MDADAEFAVARVDRHALAGLLGELVHQRKHDVSQAHASLIQCPKDQWRGPDDLTFVTKDSLSTSRLGVDFITVPTPQTLSSAQAVSRFSHTSQGAVGFGASVGPVSAMGTHSGGTSSGQLDYLDLNGDEFPDIIGNGHVHYTTPLGALEAKNRLVGPLAKVRETGTSADNLGVGGSAAFSASDSSGEVDSMHIPRKSSVIFGAARPGMFQRHRRRATRAWRAQQRA